MAGSPAGLHLWVGPDRFRKRQRLSELRDAAGVTLLDYHELPASGLTASDLLTRLHEHPAASPLRIILIEDAHKLDRAVFEALSTADPAGWRAGLFLWTEESPKPTHALWSLKPVAAMDTFAGPPAPDASKGFELVNAISRRDAGGALRALHEQLASGKEELELLGLVIWQLQRWITVARWVESGASKAEIAQATGMQPWQSDRVVAEVKDRPAAWLKRMLERCWEFDTAAKSGRIPLVRAGVEQVVVELCLPRQAEASGRGAR